MSVISPLATPGKPARLAVLVSGSGTNLEALLQACADPDYGAEVVYVAADRPGTRGQQLGEDAGIPTGVFRVGDYDNREAWDRALAAELAAHQPDLVVSAGFLKLLGPAVLQAFPGRVLNTHNALLPAFPGIHGPADAIEYGVKVAGATLFIVDAGVDTGLVLAQCVVPVLDDDDADSLLERIKVKERAQLVETIGKMVRQGWRVEGRRVFLG